MIIERILCLGEKFVIFGDCIFWVGSFFFGEVVFGVLYEEGFVVRGVEILFGFLVFGVCSVFRVEVKRVWC